MKIVGLSTIITIFSLLFNYGILHSGTLSVSEPITTAAVATIIAIACPPAAPIIFIGEVIVGSICASIGAYSAYKLFKRNKQDAGLIIYDIGYGGMPDPEDNDKNNIFERIKLKADKKMRSQRFGNFYRDPETKLWWSKDRANHGGSEFKVFKEQAKGLEWIFDADAMGKPIIEKYKGPIGLFISHKDFIVCS